MPRQLNHEIELNCFFSSVSRQLKLRQAAELWDRHGSPKGSSRASSPGPQTLDGELLIAAEAGDVEAIELLL